ncbi:hypothetical protein HELRODRAFT_184428 [Helobdella robusta]|uniref:Uncharacterized protein n=1 Tax=Helobdella robusta TaxID=6412 RepID=T1FL67_HELRO|nr:hypothetical protein HELRODRAFT_184428 [Helobdella robusta]ESN97296.1 hypothetical protein HELRODRAFT_184428 [Helobdella robusta]
MDFNILNRLNCKELVQNIRKSTIKLVNAESSLMMSGKGRSTRNANSDAVRCDKESTDVQCFRCGVSFAVGLTKESLELVKACSNVKFVCDGCLKSPSLEDQVIKSVKSGNAQICDKIDSLRKKIRLKIDAIKVKLEENKSKMSTLDIPESKLCNEILSL